MSFRDIYQDEANVIQDANLNKANSIQGYISG